jgi:hypothetical protein
MERGQHMTQAEADEWRRRIEAWKGWLVSPRAVLTTN